MTLYSHLLRKYQKCVSKIKLSRRKKKTNNMCGEAGERKQLQIQSGASALATIQRHTLVLLASPLLLVPGVQAAPPWNCSPDFLSWPGWRWIFSFNMVTIGRNCYHFGANFVMDCKCSLWTMWASCQFLPLLAQLDRVKHPRWSFYVGIRSFISATFDKI